MNKPFFGSDNFSGAHPEVMAALVEANTGQATPYGLDPWTQAGEKAALSQFGAAGTAFLALNGTGANVLALSMLLRPWEGVICSTVSHINTDETGAVEHALANKLIPIRTVDGKLTPELVEPHLHFGDEHRVITRALSISNLTELGTSYSPEEVQELVNFAHSYDMYVHMDGARISNAACGREVDISEMSGFLGVDALSLGATKNGAMGAEAVVFSERVDTTYAKHARKQNLQLLSKSRFVGAQIQAMFGTDLWQRCACVANDAARELEKALDGLDLRFSYERGGNQIFCEVPQAYVQDLEEMFGIHRWEDGKLEGHDVVRIVTAFDTTSEDVSILISTLASWMQG